MSVRVLLAPRISVEHPDGMLDEAALPGRQGRVAFAFLVLERGRPVTRGELADALWPDELPGSWETSLSAVVSKIRSFLTRAGLEDPVSSAVGCYQLRLPQDTFVDVEAAADALHEAETLIRQGSYAEAWGVVQIPYYISRRPFLPGVEGQWVERVRSRLRDLYLRAVDTRAEVTLANDEPDIVIAMAQEALAIDPYRESVYRALIRAHLARGERAEAIRAYERCRDVLATDLGIEPSTETAAMLQAIRGRQPEPPQDRIFAAVLFTDIVSSTPRTAELGDRGWRDLLDNHDALVRRELEGCGGRLVKSTGDGILATFDAPARAVRCALGIRDAVAALGLELRAGIHAGEVERRGNDLTGIAVNVARRVCDSAGTGEVLTSRTVVDLVAGSGIAFEDRGDAELKGVPGSWRLFAVGDGSP
jgi:DNA-binding SARP family transcriptional activator